jgi:hypothetical protein
MYKVLSKLKEYQEEKSILKRKKGDKSMYKCYNIIFERVTHK